jgi:hypothetical protein
MRRNPAPGGGSEFPEVDPVTGRIAGARQLVSPNCDDRPAGTVIDLVVVHGISLPPGLRQCDRLPQPIFTPATKESSGHDQNVSFDEVVKRIGSKLAEEIRARTLAIYQQAAEYARSRGRRRLRLG